MMMLDSESREVWKVWQRYGRLKAAPVLVFPYLPYLPYLLSKTFLYARDVCTRMQTLHAGCFFSFFVMEGMEGMEKAGGTRDAACHTSSIPSIPFHPENDMDTETRRQLSQEELTWINKRATVESKAAWTLLRDKLAAQAVEMKRAGAVVDQVAVDQMRVECSVWVEHPSVVCWKR